MKELEAETKEERIGIRRAWDKYTRENGIDIEWRRRNDKEVRIR